MKILHLDSNHPLLLSQLAALGCENHEDYQSDKATILSKVGDYQGVIIRSRFPIDKVFLDAAKRLKFIGRVGAGLENIDVAYAASKNIQLFNAPEGNRNAVGEHALGMLLTLFNKLHTADAEVRSGLWRREANRGIELDGQIVGIIGYGNMGRAFAKKLVGFDVEVLCYDIKSGLGDAFATQVELKELQSKATVLSIHTPQTTDTIGMVNQTFIEAFAKPFWLINTARGTSVKTADLVAALKKGHLLGAALDVLEFEKSSFENLFQEAEIPPALKALIQMPNVLLSPHIAGWTIESKKKLAQTIVDKIQATFF
ncbi:MAG: 2-hydroxyacid dehydrogenase [Flavobacteriaceae bacterium]|nr:2-hydroxyacid dehydrogenase [Flavobacteriaceae bacterium]